MAQIGEKVDSPITLLREYLTCLTALVRGERVTFRGRFVNLDNVALDWPPDPNIELLAAATGPRTLRLSGELTTGTVITGTTPDALRAAVEHVRAGLALRTEPQPQSVVTYLLCATGPNARQDIVNEIQHCGLDPATEVAAYGTADAIAAAAQRWVDAGADTIVLQSTAGTHIETFAKVRPRRGPAPHTAICIAPAASTLRSRISAA